jgi:1,2-diacylglycerol 3-beta-galactosyltransferase
MTGLVMFGGNGSSVMLDIAKRLEGLYDNLQLIFICGRNEALANELRQYQGSQKWVITTFTDDIPYYMQLANFFIGKPGNVSISEAIAMQLPVITECNAFTMIQERDCAKWVAEKGVGIVLPNFKAIDRAVAALIQPENYAHYRANLAALNNGAVFEVVGLLQKLLRSPESEAVLSQTTESPV